VQDIWKRIENWLDSNCTEILQGLLPGAKKSEIHACEKYLGVIFTGEITDSYLYHNGQTDLIAPLLGDWYLLSLDSIIKQWGIMQNLLHQGMLVGQVFSDGKVQAVWWHPQWIPIAHNGAGDFCCLDMAPTATGNIGQIISFWHTSEKREVIAESIEDWLGKFAQDLEAGNYKVRQGALRYRSAK
jgi:cell wall assembly regulator SMI1